MTDPGGGADTMRAEVVERRKAWDDPVAVAGRVLDALHRSAGGGGVEMSRDDGEWHDFDLATCASWFKKSSVSVDLRGDGGWRASLVRSRPMNVAVHTRPGPFSDDVARLAIDATLDVAMAFPEPEYGAVRLVDDRWPLYRDRGIPTLPAPFGEMLDWAVVLPPPVTGSIDREALLSAPAASVDETEDGWFVLRVYDDPADHSTPETLDRIEAVSRHLHAALRR